jgi:hypothetical protein
VRPFSANAGALLASVIAIGTVAWANGASAHGDEAAFHNVKGSDAPTLQVSASGDGPRVRVRLDTSNFTWATSSVVANFVPGEGAARVYLDTNRVARVFSPEFTLDTRAWNLSPGGHTITVVLTGSDLISYAADGEEVEVTVPFMVSAGSEGLPHVEAPLESSFTVTGARDPFGGWVFSSRLEGFEAAGASLEFSINGRAFAQTGGGSIHVYPDAIVGRQWQEESPLPVITATAVTSDSVPYAVGERLAAISFAAPTSTQAATWSWDSRSSTLPIGAFVLFLVLVGGGLLVFLLVKRSRRRERVVGKVVSVDAHPGQGRETGD